MTAETAGTSKLYYGWIIVAGLSVTEMVSWGVLIYAFPVLAVPMHDEFGWSYAQLNAGYSMGIVVSAVAAIPVGRWLQRHGPRALMTTGSLVTCVAVSAWSQVRFLPMYFVVWTMAGLAMAMTLYEPALATTTAWFSANRARAVLVLTMIAGLSSFLFAPLTGVLISAWGWRYALLVLAALAAVVGLPIHALLLRRSPADLGLVPPGDPASRPAVPLPRDCAEASHMTVVRRASFGWLASSLTLATLAKTSVVVGLVTYLAGRGFSLSAAALATGGLGLAQIVGRIALVGLRHRSREQHLATAAFVLQAAAVAWLLATTGHTVSAAVAVVAFVVFFGMGCGLVELLRGTVLADYYGVHHYPRVNGLLSTFVVGARATAPVAVGGVITATSTATPVLAATAAIAVASGGALLLADRVYWREETAAAGPTRARPV